MTGPFVPNAVRRSWSERGSSQGCQDEVLAGSEVHDS